MIYPRPTTLKKYGLSLEDFIELANLQGNVCPICKRVLEKPVIDHFHARGWKKMRPERRKLYVRGICCNYCNRRRIAKGMSLDIAQNIVDYLQRYEARKPK